MSEYLSPTDDGAFVDYPPIGEPHGAATELCPKCKGHGGWNLVLNSYKLREGQEDTPENRHRYVHFRANCDNCGGWGYVVPGSLDASCLHDYKFYRNEGHCLNSYQCSKCKKTVTYDSSD
jgi:hypothetical protein